MKMTDKKKPTPTIPSGVWESSRPNENKDKDKTTNSITTDLQGNGYPLDKQGKQR